MGVGSAAGGLVELRQRQRRAQPVAPRLLLQRNGDGGEERFLGRAAFAGSRLSKISPRTRWVSASNHRCP